MVLCFLEVLEIFVFCHVISVNKTPQLKMVEEIKPQSVSLIVLHVSQGLCVLIKAFSDTYNLIGEGLGENQIPD